MQSHPSIVFTGGGTAGHVTPNIALITVLRQQHWRMHYIGSTTGVEREMISHVHVPYYGIRCGKLRRYWSLKNIWDPVNTLIGIFQSIICLLRIKPHIVFSKGGFVAFPVVIAAWILRIPVIAHESDFTPGLANRLSFPFVKCICVTFAAAKNNFKHSEKVCVTGTPLRATLFEGSRERGLANCHFNETHPCILVMGGGQGSTVINACIREALPTLLTTHQVIHLCGKAQVDQTLRCPGYYQIEYAEEALGDLLAASDMVISRAGANTLYELLALEKPHILIPLSRQASRGDQLQNAAYFEEQGISRVIQEETLTVPLLLETIHQVEVQAPEIKAKMKALQITSATEVIVTLLKRFISKV